MRIAAALAGSLVAGIGTTVFAPLATADDSVTYEVVSNSIGTANVEYQDRNGRVHLANVGLPWRTSVVLADARSVSTEGAQVRADWRSHIAAPVWRPGQWVTVRVYVGGVLACESTLDLGNATCYGATPYFS
jgi:hypothetical protein